MNRPPRFLQVGRLRVAKRVHVEMELRSGTAARGVEPRDRLRPRFACGGRIACPSGTRRSVGPADVPRATAQTPQGRGREERCARSASGERRHRGGAIGHGRLSGTNGAREGRANPRPRGGRAQARSAECNENRPSAPGRSFCRSRRQRMRITGRVHVPSMVFTRAKYTPIPASPPSPRRPSHTKPQRPGWNVRPRASTRTSRPSTS